MKAYFSHRGVLTHIFMSANYASFAPVGVCNLQRHRILACYHVAITTLLLFFRRLMLLSMRHYCNHH